MVAQVPSCFHGGPSRPGLDREKHGEPAREDGDGERNRLSHQSLPSCVRRSFRTTFARAEAVCAALLPWSTVIAPPYRPRVSRFLATPRPPAPGRYSKMKVLTPVGMTRTPKPFTSASKTMNGFSRGTSASTCRFVSFTAFVATVVATEKATKGIARNDCKHAVYAISMA
jgi:hypothetical protein